MPASFQDNLPNLSGDLSKFTSIVELAINKTGVGFFHFFTLANTSTLLLQSRNHWSCTHNIEILHSVLIITVCMFDY